MPNNEWGSGSPVLLLAFDQKRIHFFHEVNQKTPAPPVISHAPRSKVPK